ncbi:MAG: GAF domain-containing protein, partial [Ardenticatenia bacterium]|nr:GAF domain-containing protein [Ardenticatenia bacterium]
MGQVDQHTGGAAERKRGNARSERLRHLLPSSIGGYVLGTYLLLVLFIGAAIWGIQYQAQRLTREATQMLSSSFQEYRLVKELHSWAVESEAALLDFLVTGDPASRNEYELYRDRFFQLLNEAEENPSISPETRAALEQIEALGIRWFRDVADPVVAAHHVGEDGASSVVEEPLLQNVLENRNPMLKGLYAETYALATRVQAQIERYEMTIAEEQERFGLVTIGLATLLFSIIVLAGWQLATTITHPIARLTESARQSGGGKFQPVHLERAPHELHVLADAFNHMVSSLNRNEDELVALNRQLEQRLRELNALLEISRSVTGSLDFDEVLRRILRESVEAFPKARKAIVHLVDETTNRLYPVALSEGREPVQDNMGMPIGHGVAGRAVLERRSFCIPDTSQDPAYLDFGTEVNALLVAPLIIGDRVIGALSIDSDQRAAFSPDQLPVLESLASHVAIAIENARPSNESQHRLSRADLACTRRPSSSPAVSTVRRRTTGSSS